MKPHKLIYPRLSFCIPAFKYNTLRDAIESIKKLKDLDKFQYEIIISDDSLNDDIKKYVNKLHDSYIFYYRNVNKGSCNNHNNAVKNALYDWVITLHDDDIFHSDYLVEVFNGRQDYKNIDIIWTGKYLINKEGRTINYILSKKTKEGIIISGFKYLNLLLSRHDITPPNSAGLMLTGLAIRKNLIIKSQVLLDQNIGLGADMLYVYSLLLYSNKILYINKPLTGYRYIDNMTERSVASFDGSVFNKSKAILDIIISKIGKKVNPKEFKVLKKVFKKSFYVRSMNINGPIIWTSLRFRGSYIKRLKTQLLILSEIILNAPIVLTRPKTYFILFISILPQFILRIAHKLYISHIL